MSSSSLPAEFFEYDIVRVEFSRPLFGGGGWLYIVNNKRDFRDPTWLDECEVTLTFTQETLDNTNAAWKSSTIKSLRDQVLGPQYLDRVITGKVKDLEFKSPAGKLFEVGDEFGLAIQENA